MGNGVIPQRTVSTANAELYHNMLPSLPKEAQPFDDSCASRMPALPEAARHIEEPPRSSRPTLLCSGSVRAHGKSTARETFAASAQHTLLDMRKLQTSRAQPHSYGEKRRASAPAVFALGGVDISSTKSTDEDMAECRRHRRASFSILEEALRRGPEQSRCVMKELTEHSSESLRPASVASIASSSVQWDSPSSALIILDWDDTLFPTSWLNGKDWFREWVRKPSEMRTQPDDASVVIPPEDAAFLEELDNVAESFLSTACSLGHVSCVTLSRRPWQSDSMQRFMPKLAVAWDDNGVIVRYAREEKSVFLGLGLGSAAPEDPRECLALTQAMHAQQKQKAMERVLRKFYQGGSWKNVVSIGDGSAERRALQEIGFRHDNPTSPKTGEQKRLRVKTVKMMEDPSHLDLQSELLLLQACLPPIVCLNRDFDLELSSGHMSVQQVIDLVTSTSRPSSANSSESSRSCSGVPERQGEAEA